LQDAASRAAAHFPVPAIWRRKGKDILALNSHPVEKMLFAVEMGGQIGLNVGYLKCGYKIIV
jgi:hypothetical protein